MSASHRAAASAAITCAWLVLAFPGSALAAATTEHPYVALGDSWSVGLYASSPEKGFVGLLYPDYTASLGANALSNEAQSGATSTSLRNGGQLTAAAAARVLGDAALAVEQAAFPVALELGDRVEPVSS